MGYTTRVKRFGAACVLAVVALQATGCGTMLYPERKGQTSGKIDPGVAILDGAGLLLYIIPGLIAFGVDFSTGAIYLPPGSSKLDSADDDDTHVVQIDPGSLNHERIEQVIAQATGHTGVFEHHDLKVTRFTDTERFLSAYTEARRPAQ